MRIDRDGFAIRSVRIDDTELLARRADNPRIAENLQDRFPHPYTLEDARQWVEAALHQGPETHFVIEVEGEAAGTIGLELGADVYGHSAEIGYWLAEQYWGRGIATAAVRELTEWGFSTFGLVRVQALVFENNAASVRVLEKAGFELEGRMRRAVVKNGRMMDQLLYGKLAPREIEGEAEDGGEGRSRKDRSDDGGKRRADR